jgi:hypothetical protein
MKIVFQVKEGGVLNPFSEEDKEAMGNYKLNQVVTGDIKGTTKKRSLEHLRLFMACCSFVARNTEDGNWNTKEKVVEQIKIKLRYIKTYIVLDDRTVQFITDSISFERMAHMESVNFINNGINELAAFLGVSTDELVENVKREIGGV